MVNPNLRIDTNSLQVNYPAEDGDSSVSARLLSPTGRERSLSISQTAIIPSFRISNAERSPVTESISTLAASQGIGKAKHESRKLLAHILGQLRRRTLPPSLIKVADFRTHRSEKSLDSVLRSMKNLTSNRPGKFVPAHKATEQENSDDDSLIDDREFNTDDTFNLLSQVGDVLHMSVAQQWDIFTESGGSLDPPKSPSRNSEDRSTSFLRRRSMQTSRSRSRSTSRKRHVEAPELLSECISVLSSVILEDCRYRISAPKPSRPPYALQSLTLDIAHFLLYAHWNNPRTVSQIILAILPAFQSFPYVMHTRLLAFFEEGVLGETLEQLRRLQGRHNVTSHSPDEPFTGDTTPPSVSILVDEVHEDHVRSPLSAQNWRRWTSPDPGFHSSNAPEQDLAMYFLTSVVSPLIAAIMENVDLSSSDMPMIHRFHRLIDRLINGKPDVYLDLLSVIAYHTPQARRQAASLLLSYWPKAVGHIVLSKPLPDISYSAAVARQSKTGRQSLTRFPSIIDLPHAHQFTPWRFSSSSLPRIFEGFSQNECRVCSEPMEGFGLSCPFCMCSVHFDCYDYPEGSFFTQYSLESDPNMQKVALHRFCNVLPVQRDGSDPFIHLNQHLFRVANIFSLALCFVCKKPLWGCVMQGLKCNSCKHFVHSSCLNDALPRCRDANVTSSHMTIRWSTLRRSFVEHYRELAFTEADIIGKSHEEMSVFYAVLWTQLHILNNGIALGSIVIDDDSSDTSNEAKLQEFELHYLVLLFETYLSSGNLPVSDALSDYLSENRLRAQDHIFYFDWNTLAYIVSVVKMPCNALSKSDQSVDLLNVAAEESPESDVHPFEVVSLAHVRNQFGDFLQLGSEAAVRHLLSHIQHIGLLHRLDRQPSLWEETPHPERLQCCFPIPFGFDVSVDIETLVAVIEACLSDLDLSVNEIGLLVLIRRFWPNGMLSEYSFQRLSKAILTWIFAEDDNLAIILRDYVARGRSLPGVRSDVEVQSWPNQAHFRPNAVGSASNGGDYVAGRRALLQRYAAPWMLAFHDRDVGAYADTLYELLVEYAGGTYRDDYLLGPLSEKEEQKRNATISDRILRHIIKICQASVVFTVFEDLFHRWLQEAHTLNIHAEPSLSLPRLFNRESEGSQRFSTVVDTRLSVSDMSSVTSTNPLYELLNAAKASKEGFERGLHWLCLFVSSGVDVPISAFMQMAELASQFQANLDQCALLIKAGLWSSWLKSLGRQDLQAMVSTLHVHLTAQILDGLQSRQNLEKITAFIRQSLATCLLLYGCERNNLITHEMILEDEIRSLPSRRKMVTRVSMLTDPIIVDSALMNVLKSYVEMAVDEVSCLAARFLNFLVNESPLLESYEVDNFILRNGSNLCQCMWLFYGIELSDVSVTRASLLIRVLVVDNLTFQALLGRQFDQQNDWDSRMQSISWLFRMVLDVTSPAFLVEDRQWRASVTDIFYYFFSALWLDDREEIRLTVETWSETLLPAHQEAIALCWNEALSKAPIVERGRLVHFLLQLHPHFPSWRVLHWNSIIETLLENDFIQKNGDDEEGPAAAHLSMYGLSNKTGKDASINSDSELRLLQVALISLSLRMIADGVDIDITSLLKVKEHLVRLLGFSDVALVASGAGQSFYIDYNVLDSLANWSFPCLDDLMLVLDASYPFDLAPSAMGGPYADEDTSTSLLVGSAFIDILLNIFIHAEQMLTLPPLTLKNLLKALLIVIYKHDLDSKPLRHLQGRLRRAVRQALDLISNERHLSYELRQLALAACQAFITRWPSIIGNFICDAIEAAAKLMVSLNYEQCADDMLVSQARLFLSGTLTRFAMSGVLNILFKRQLSSDFFLVLRYVMETKPKGAASTQSQMDLPDTLLRDTLPRAVDNDFESYQTVIENINSYVEVIYHKKYSAELMQFIGLFLTNVARRTAEWSMSAFDPSPLLLMACTVIQHNKAQCRALLAPLETFIRASLTRFNVSQASITKVLQVTTSLYRKVTSPDQMLSSNHIALALLELLHAGLVGKARITPSTITSLVEAITSAKDTDSYLSLPRDTAKNLAEAGISYLHSDGLYGSSLVDFTASQVVAKMILTVSQEQPQILSHLPSSRMAVRAWNLFLLSALSASSGATAQMMFNYLSSFASAYSRSLNSYTQISPTQLDSLHSDMSRAYASIKLWLLLCRKAAASDHDILEGTRGNPTDKEALLCRIVWNELWPPFETVVLTLETDVQTGNAAAVASTVASSVADLFIFLRQTQCVVAKEVSSQVQLLNRLRSIKRAEAKITRVLRSFSDLPSPATLETLITQTRTEIWAEEKLEAAKRQDGPRVIRRMAS